MSGRLDPDGAAAWRHREAAGDLAAARAAAVRAGLDAAGRGELREATAWFDRGLDRLDGVDPESLIEAAMTAATVGRVELAERWARAADEALRALGRDEQAERMWSDRALRYVRRPGTAGSGREALAGDAERAELAARAGDVETARSLAKRILAGADPLADSELAARAAIALYSAGDAELGIETLRMLRARAFDAGDARLEAWRAGDLAACSAGLGDVARGIGYERAGLTTLAGLDDDLLVPSLHVGLACLRAIAGELDEAKKVTEALAAHPSPLTGLLARAPGMIIAISEGRHDDALRTATEVAPFRDIAGPYLFGIVLTVEAYAHFMHGDHERAGAALDDLDGWVGGVFHQSLPIRVGLRTRLLAAAGDRAGVERTLERATDMAAHPLAGPGLAGNRELAAGLLHRLDGRPDLAVSHLQRAGELLASSPRMIPAGLAWCDAAEAAVETGDPHRGRDLLDRVDELIDQRGLSGLRPRADGVRAQLMAALPHLSPREVELMSLLARGLTNKAMATAMYLSPRTVRNQLHALFGKLGVSRRAEAAAIAERLGLTAPRSSGAAAPAGPHDEPATTGAPTPTSHHDQRAQ